MQLRKNLGIKGDTIVEVMLALSVLGAVIVGGYSIATRSLNGVRVSQERSEALKIAESQLEVVRQVITGTNNINELAVYDSTGAAIDFPAWFGKAPGSLAPVASDEYGFCVSDSGTSVRIDLTAAEIPNITAYPNECRRGIYHVYTNTDFQIVSTSASLLYTTYITWEKAGGNGLETLELQGRYLIFGK